MAGVVDFDLIAPCGMDCAVCSAYLAFKNNLPLHKCVGCRTRNKQCSLRWQSSYKKKLKNISVKNAES